MAKVARSSNLEALLYWMRIILLVSTVKRTFPLTTMAAESAKGFHSSCSTACTVTDNRQRSKVKTFVVKRGILIIIFVFLGVYYTVYATKISLFSDITAYIMHLIGMHYENPS